MFTPPQDGQVLGATGRPSYTNLVAAGRPTRPVAMPMGAERPGRHTDYGAMRRAGPQPVENFHPAEFQKRDPTAMASAGGLQPPAPPQGQTPAMTSAGGLQPPMPPQMYQGGQATTSAGGLQQAGGALANLDPAHVAQLREMVNRYLQLAGLLGRMGQTPPSPAAANAAVSYDQGGRMPQQLYQMQPPQTGRLLGADSAGAYYAPPPSPAPAGNPFLQANPYRQ